MLRLHSFAPAKQSGIFGSNKVSWTQQGLKGLAVISALFLLAGCGLFGSSPEPEEALPTRVPVPTFTATVEAAVPPQPAQPVEQATLPPQPSHPEPAAAPTNTEAPPPPTSEPATATPEPKAQVVVTQAQVNTRNGPGTDYGISGSAVQNDRFDVVAKNAAGDWWKVCCVNGQQVWIFGQLVTAENVANVAVDANIPPPPVAQQPTQPPAQPTQPPAAAATATPPPPPVAADPCANIGGDGCKFKLKGGPSFSDNGGNE